MPWYLLASILGAGACVTVVAAEGAIQHRKDRNMTAKDRDKDRPAPEKATPPPTDSELAAIRELVHDVADQDAAHDNRTWRPQR